MGGAATLGRFSAADMCPDGECLRQTSIGSGGIEAPRGRPTTTGSDVVGKGDAHV